MLRLTAGNHPRALVEAGDRQALFHPVVVDDDVDVAQVAPARDVARTGHEPVVAVDELIVLARAQVEAGNILHPEVAVPGQARPRAPLAVDEELAKVPGAGRHRIEIGHPDLALARGPDANLVRRDHAPPGHSSAAGEHRGLTGIAAVGGRPRVAPVEPHRLAQMVAATAHPDGDGAPRVPTLAHAPDHLPCPFERRQRAVVAFGIGLRQAPAPVVVSIRRQIQRQSARGARVVHLSRLRCGIQ